MIVALVGQKGGSGKTTAALALACELASRGHDVLLVDADPQGSCLTFADEAARQKREHTPTVVAMHQGLHHQVGKLAKSYDDVIIDCPPRIAETQRAALMVARIAIIPCGPSAVDAWAIAESVALVREAQKVRGRPSLQAFVLLTRKSKSTAIGKGARKALAAAGLPILRSELSQRVVYQEAPAAGMGVGAYAPKSPGAQELKRLADEVLHWSVAR